MLSREKELLSMRFCCMMFIFILDYIKGTKRIEGVLGGVERILGGCCDDADDDDEGWLSSICIDYVYCDFGCSFCSFFFVE